MLVILGLLTVFPCAVLVEQLGWEGLLAIGLIACFAIPAGMASR